MFRGVDCGFLVWEADRRLPLIANLNAALYGPRDLDHISRRQVDLLRRCFLRA